MRKHYKNIINNILSGYSTVDNYAVNLIGTHHETVGMPCQDSYTLFETDFLRGVAVADGLGSKRCADIGSRYAVYLIEEVIKQSVTTNMLTDEQMLQLLKWSFEVARTEIIKYALSKEHNPDDYCTTLCVAVMYNGRVYFGNAGDSGCIALLQDGRYVKLTSQCRDSSNGGVYHLFYPNHWKFGVVHKPVVSVMLMTDGVWDIMVPKYLGREINIELADKFLNCFGKSDEAIKNLQIDAGEYLKKHCRDDITMVVLSNIQLRNRMINCDISLGQKRNKRVKRIMYGI